MVLVVVTLSGPIVARAQDLVPATYQGGPVEVHPRVFLIFWGPWWCGSTPPPPGATTCPQPTETSPPPGGPQDIEQQTETLFSLLGGSRYNAILSQYCQGIPPGSQSCGSAQSDDFVHNDTYLGGTYIYTAAPNNAPSTEQQWNHDVLNQLVPAVDAAQGWRPTTDTQYVVLFEKDYRVDEAITASHGGKGCSDHGTESGAAGTVSFDKVPVPPLPTDPSSAVCGADPNFVTQVITAYASHEYAEAVTNPAPTVNGAPAPAWTAPDGEVADYCTDNYLLATPAELQGITVTQLWSNAAGGCASSLQMATAPTNVLATVNGPNAATVSWQPASATTTDPISGYVVSVQEAGDGPLQLSQGVLQGATQVTVTGLNGGSSYSFSVQAVVGGDIGPSGTSSLLPVPGPAQTYARRVLASDPTLYYRLDDAGNFPVAEDASGNGHPGVWQYQSASFTSGALLSDPDPGASSNGIAPIVVDSRDQGLPLGNAPRSVELWIDPSASSPGPEDLFDYGAATTAESFGAKILDSTSLDVWTWDNDVTFDLPYGMYFSSGWHQVVVTYDGNQHVTAFFDGLPMGTKKLGRPLATQLDQNGLQVGAGAGGPDFAGSIDEFAVYGQALTATDVRTHFTAAGYSLAPNVVFDPASVAFGPTPTGSSATQSVRVVNYGVAPLQITGVSLTGDPSFSVSSDGCSGAVVGPGRFCTTSITFAPTSLSNATASLSVQDGLPNSPQSAPISGGGTGAWQTVPLTTMPQMRLRTIRGVATNDAWVVGSWYPFSGPTSPLIEHWDGRAWSVFSSAAVPGATGAELNGVTAVSRSRAWAVGYSSTSSGQRPFVQQWNGTAWRTLSVPASGTFSVLYAVSADAQNDVWAVGYSSSGYPQEAPFVEHWNGTSWTTMAPPVQAGWTGELRAVVAIRPNDVWAVGSTTTGNIAGTRIPLIEHWDGTAWSMVSHPSWTGGNGASLAGVAAVSSTDVWAAGAGTSAIVGHWDGTSWSDASPPVPSGCAFYDGVNDVAAPSATSVFAVGTAPCSAGYAALVEHWDGSFWNVQQPPGPLGSLASVFATSDGRGWALGQTCLSSTCPLFVESYG